MNGIPAVIGGNVTPEPTGDDVERVLTRELLCETGMRNEVSMSGDHVILQTFRVGTPQSITGGGSGGLAVQVHRVVQSEAS